MEVRPTLSDLAKAAGLSISAVSQALRDQGTVSRKTCRRVQDLARKMGYVPNPVIAAMASKRPTSKKGHLVPIALLFSGEEGRTRLPVPLIAQERAEALGYQLEGFQMPRGQEKELSRMLYHRGFVGVILDVLYGYEQLPNFEWNHFSVIKRGRDFFKVPFHGVRHSAFDEIHLAWDEIRKRNYKRIGVLLFEHSAEHPDDIARQGAIMQAQSCLGPGEVAIPPLRSLQSNEKTTIPRWFQQHQPDAVLAFHLGQYFTLLDAGIPIGTEIGFACLNLQQTDLSRFSGLADSIPEQFERAVDLIDLQFRHHHYGPVEKPTSTLIMPTWNNGTTLRQV